MQRSESLLNKWDILGLFWCYLGAFLAAYLFYKGKLYDFYIPTAISLIFLLAIFLLYCAYDLKLYNKRKKKELKIKTL